MQPSQPLEGVLHVFSETGSEGGYWAFQDKRFIEPPLPPSPHERWSYEGLHLLEDGDFLTIYDKDDPQKVLWHGWIRLDEFPPFTQATSTGMWVRAEQKGVARIVWEKYFLDGHPAKLIPAP